MSVLLSHLQEDIAMTTARSPLRVLKKQASKMAEKLKAMERGDHVAVSDPAGKLAAARQRESFTFGVAMDDKILQISMTWNMIREMSEVAISEYILKKMREEREQ